MIKLNENEERIFREYIIKAFNLWGEDSQYLQLSEELSELVVSANHMRRGRGNIENFKEEIADSLLMILEFMLYHKISNEEIMKMIELKRNVFYKRVDDYEKMLRLE